MVIVASLISLVAWNRVDAMLFCLYGTTLKWAHQMDALLSLCTLNLWGFKMMPHGQCIGMDISACNAICSCLVVVFKAWMP
jgi:hypothetical protein